MRDALDALCGFVRARVRGVKAIHIRQEHEQARMHHCGYLRAERIVVSQAQLIDGNGIVFVNDGHSAALQDNLKRVKCVFIPPAVSEIIPCQQDLRTHNAARGKKPGVFFKQKPLPHGRSRLLCGDARGPLCIADAPKARRYGAGGH